MRIRPACRPRVVGGRTGVRLPVQAVAPIQVADTTPASSVELLPLSVHFFEPPQAQVEVRDRRLDSPAAAP